VRLDHPSVRLNLDLGNLIRLRRLVEHWLSMVEKTAPFAGYWHVKNYIRTEDESTGRTNCRVAIRKAIEHGFRSAFLVRALRRWAERQRHQPRLPAPHSAQGHRLCLGAAHNSFKKGMIHDPSEQRPEAVRGDRAARLL
jgi:hypothetical protein